MGLQETISEWKKRQYYRFGYNDPLILALIYYNTRLEQGDSYI